MSRPKKKSRLQLIRKGYWWCNGHGTEWVNKHPICRMYAEQISFLAGSDTDSYMRASNAVEEIIMQWRD
jgi:hypothetical protein